MKKYMKEQVLELWVCRTERGEMCVFAELPNRDRMNGIWYGTVLGSLDLLLQIFKIDFPAMKWEDEPRKMIVSIKF